METAQPSVEVKKQGSWKWSLGNPYILAIVVAAILLLLVYLRTGLLQYQGLFEPDGFFYYTAIRQVAIAGNVGVNMPVLLSGYPWHNGFHEAAGVIYMTLIPYLFLKYLGLSLISVMRWVPIAFGILDAIAAYFLVQHLSKSRAMGLVAMFFIATSSGNIARTAGGVYRGDTFISFFVMLALILMLKVMDESNSRKKYAYLALTAIVVGMGNAIWNGGVIVPAVYLTALIAIAAYGFVVADRKALKDCLMLWGAMLAAYLISNGFVALSLANPNVLTSTNFLVLYIPAVLGTVAAYYIIGKKSSAAFTPIAGTLKKRILFLVVAVAVLGILVYAVAGSYISNLFTNGGSIYNYGGGESSNVAATTQELQPPTLAFLWASFGLQLYLAPLAVILFVLFAHVHGNRHRISKGRLSLNMGYGFVALFVYLFMTAYLQNGAIRYNSMLAEPLAIFSAYAIYLVYTLLKDYSIVFRGAELKFGYIWIGVFFALAVFQASLTQAQSFSSTQADGVNPYFLSAMTWLSQNTPKNATVDDLWPDGSLVEGWGNRTSFQDSVGGENGTRILQFGKFIFNSSTDLHYLVDQAYKPQYLLVRNFWFNELGGIAIEANLTGNLSEYGYNVFTGFNAGGNATHQVYQFTSSTYTAEVDVTPGTSAMGNVTGFIAPTGQNSFVPLAHIEFMNTTSGSYTMVNSSANGSANLTMLIALSGRNISSAAIVGPKLAQSNFFRFIMQCGYTECAFGNASVSAQVVYMNPDSKIIKLTYH